MKPITYYCDISSEIALIYGSHLQKLDATQKFKLMEVIGYLGASNSSLDSLCIKSFLYACEELDSGLPSDFISRMGRLPLDQLLGLQVFLAENLHHLLVTDQVEILYPSPEWCGDCGRLTEQSYGTCEYCGSSNLFSQEEADIYLV
ncbi:MAG: hypothetical protein F6K41_24025 [Symploca sp. SIO3E6]|nr:hypothetical protein [Caldora sp. SIO3E6]